MLFPLGRLVATPSAFALPGSTIADLIHRHSTGDYGETQTGENDPDRGDRIFSAYQVGAQKYFVITEADRSSTCILKAEDY